MTRWELFVAAVENCRTPIFLVLLLVCIVGLIRALIGREHQEGG